MFKNADEIRSDLIKEIEKLKREQHFKQIEGIKLEDDEEKKFDFQEGYYLYRQRYEATISSTSWKVTQPIRKLIDLLNQKNTCTMEKQFNSNHKRKNNVELSQSKKGIAVICIALAEDLLSEVLKRLDYIKEPIDLYLPDYIEEFHHNKKIKLKCINTLEKENFMEYEVVLCLRVEKATFIRDLDGVLSDDKMVKQVISILREGMPRGGMISGDPSVDDSWKRLFEREDNANKIESLFYPWNSCFWLKPNAVEGITYDIIELIKTPKGLLMLPELVKENEYAYYLYNSEKKEFFEEKSREFIKKYLVSQDKWMKEKYELYVIDIFDTLFTNLFYDSNGFYQLLERKFEKQYHFNWKFSRVRLEAEMQAKDIKQRISIRDIYLQIQKMTGCTDEVLIEMQKQEIQQWTKTTIPRREILNFCQKKNVPVVFVNNSFLENSDVAYILEQYGMDGSKIRAKDEIEFEGKQTLLYLTSRYYTSEFPRQGKTMLLLTSQMQFYLSNQYDKFKKYLDGSLENSLMLGILINKHLYNSHVSLRADGTAECSEIIAVAEGIIGPIFLAFMEYIEDTTYNNEQLLFLAREGWFLQRMYKQYCKMFRKEERENCYFYTSRRAASIPQISSCEDIKELLRSPYSGKLSTFMRERFGLELKGEDAWIKSLNQEHIKVLNTLLEQFDEFEEKIRKERQLYLKYVEQEINQDRHITVIDVGYSASIQYYLMRLLKKQLSGCYLATEKNIKTEKINGVSRGMYHFWSNPIFSKLTLFIEAIACAPHGQVIHFEESNRQIHPVLKEKENIDFKKAELIQAKVLDYVKLMGELLFEIPHKFSHELALDLFTELLRKGLINAELKQLFAVNDEYCNDGEWYFDKKRDEWKLKQRS